MLAAAVLPGLSGLVLATFVFRTRGVYFAITTVALNLVFTEALSSFEQLTGGAVGISGIAAPLGAIGSSASGHLTYVIAVAIVAVVGLLYFETRQRAVGLYSLAVRENEALAESIGINAMRSKAIAFVAGAVIAGLLGSVYASYAGFISPTTFNVWLSFDIIIVLIAGGLGTFVGAPIGALVLAALPEALRVSETWRNVLYGAILLLLVIRWPGGVRDAGATAWRGAAALVRRPRSTAPPPAVAAGAVEETRGR
jgi:branched-chain amino acid transport system permease protein